MAAFVARVAGVASVLGAAAAVFATPATARADEGMWPFNMVPAGKILKDHRVSLDEAWLNHVRLSSVRFNSGGSGSFVSGTGLILTNHHVASDCIAKIASAGHDYLADGYVAGKDGDEIRCPDLELNQLLKIDDVTAIVKAAKLPNMSDADANVAMKGKMSSIEQACAQASGASRNRCDVVTLYGGGMYHLYTYKKLTDIRLVFAPEKAIAFFGGDAENFTYPRFDLDMAIFRAYESGQPVHPSDYLKWSPTGPKDGDVVFASGNPGRTHRSSTVAQLQTLRDYVMPWNLEALTKTRAALLDFGRTGSEARREIDQPLFREENSIKAYTGMLDGLKNRALMKRKSDDEAAFKAQIVADANLRAKYGAVFDQVAAVQQTYRDIFARYAVLEGGATELMRIARDLVRLPTELATPNHLRLREYRDSNLESRKLGLFSDAPVYGNVDLAELRVWLDELSRNGGSTASIVIGAGRTTRRVAQEILARTRLSDVYERKSIASGGKNAIDASSDAMIELMRAIDPDARAIRKRYEDEVEAPTRQDAQQIAEAIFALKGTTVPPDATFTLRLSVGVVAGYNDGGHAVPWATDFEGLFRHANGSPPRKLPQRWVDKQASVHGTTPLNFASTLDIVGGSSGSPVVDASGNLVGLVFDGNLASLANDFVYDETTSRAVSVDSAAILEALVNVYDAGTIVQELMTP